MEDFTIKVTNLGEKRGWGCRIFSSSGTLIDESIVSSREEIGDACRELLRWRCKLGSSSPWAINSRKRLAEQIRLSNEIIDEVIAEEKMEK